jgi:hypothetical protein
MSKRPTRARAKAMKDLTYIEKRIVDAGVRNLHKFGYPSCSAENILIDRIYKQFFASMLESNRHQGQDAAIDHLLELIGAPPADPPQE